MNVKRGRQALRIRVSVPQWPLWHAALVRRLRKFPLAPALEELSVAALRCIIGGPRVSLRAQINTHWTSATHYDRYYLICY